MATGAIGEFGPILKLKSQMTWCAVPGGPVLEAGLGQAGGDVDALEVELGGRREHAHRAHDGEADGHQRHDDAQAGGDAGQVQRQPGAAGHHQVAEHALGEVDRSRRRPERGGHDEAEDVEHPGHEPGVDVVAAGGSVGVGRDGVEQQPDEKKTVGMPMVTSMRAIISPRRLRSSMNRVVIMASGRDPRSPVVGARCPGARRCGARAGDIVVIRRPPVGS